LNQLSFNCRKRSRSLWFVRFVSSEMDKY